MSHTLFRVVAIVLFVAIGLEAQFPIQLAFASAPQTIATGAASSAVTVQSQDASGSRTNVLTTTSVNLSASSASMAFFADAALTRPVSQISIPSGSDSAVFWFRDTTAGSATITALATVMLPAQQIETFFAVPSVIRYATAPQTVAAGSYSVAVGLRLEDSFGNLAPAIGQRVIQLDCASATMEFYSTSLALLTSVTIPHGSATAVFRFRDTTAGTPTIQASGSNFPPALQTATIQALPLTQLRFATAPQSLTVWAASGAVTVRTTDTFGNPVPPALPKVVSLTSSSGSLTFYADAALTTPVTSRTIPGAATTATFWFRDTVPGAPTITATTSGLSAAVQTETVNAGPPSGIEFITAPQTITAGTGSAVVTIRTRDTFGNPAPVPSLLQVFVFANSTSMQFFADAALTTPVTFRLIGTGQHSASFWFRDTTAGTPTISTSATGITGGTQGETVLAGAASSLAFTTAPQDLLAAQPSSVVTVQSRDQFGNVANVAGTQTVNLSSTSVSMGFFADAGLVTPITSRTIPAGANAASFYLRDFTAGTHTVTAASAGLAQATQDETIRASQPTGIVFLTAPQTVAAGAASNVVTVQARDQFGNASTWATQQSVPLLSSSPTMVFFGDAALTTPVTSCTFAATSTDTSFWFRDTTPGTPSITVLGWNTPPQNQTIVAGPPAALVFLTAPQSLNAGAPSSAVTLQLRDTFGNPTNTVAPTTVHLTATSSRLTFYANPNLTSIVTSLTIAPGTNSATFYFADLNAGTPSITAAAAGVGSAQQGATIAPGPANNLAFVTAPQFVYAGSASNVATVQTQDIFGNVSNVTSTRTVSLTANSGSLTFFADAALTMPVTNRTIASGASLASFWFHDTTPGTPSITATLNAGGFVTQSETILAPSGSSLLVPAGQALTNSGTTTSAFTTTGSRFQAVYDASLFTTSGVSGPVTITRLHFRAADGRRGLGGQSYQGATVQLGVAAVDHAALTSTFDINRGAMGPAAVTTISLGASEGRHPNTYVVDIDLVPLGATFVYDPAAGDLLVDITMPSAPTAVDGLESFASSSTASHLGRFLSSTPASPTGTLSDFTPVMKIDFVGPGGWPAVVAARVESFGAGCGAAASSFYQHFPESEDFDLRSRSLLLVPNDPTTPAYYTVSGGSTPVDLSAAALGAAPVSTADNALISFAPGFTIRFPGGTAATLGACTNGFVWLGTGTGMTFVDSSPSVPAWLGNTAVSPRGPRVAPCWHDFHAGRNSASHPGSGLYVNTSGSPGNRITCVTWKEVGEANTQSSPQGISVNSFQCAFFENGNVEFRYGAMDGVHFGRAIAGFSRGRLGGTNAVDSGSRDLSFEVPFRTSAEGGPAALIQTCSTRPILGTSVVFQCDNVPASSLIAASFLDVAGLSPGASFPPLLPGCLRSLPNPITHQLFVSPTASLVSIPFVIPPSSSGWMGTGIRAQYVTLDAGGGIYASNALRLRLGLQ